MTFIGYNATGWVALQNGHMITAAFTMYDTALMGWTIAILFMVYQFMLYRKTESLILGWLTGMFFLAMYITAAQAWLPPNMSFTIIWVIVIFQLAIILYGMIFR
jgi:hypothetical protein